MIDRINEKEEFIKKLSFDNDFKDHVIIIYGEDGSGKSYFVEQVLTSNDNFIAIKFESLKNADERDLVNKIFKSVLHSNKNFYDNFIIKHYDLVDPDALDETVVDSNNTIVDEEIDKYACLLSSLFVTQKTLKYNIINRKKKYLKMHQLTELEISIDFLELINKIFKKLEKKLIVVFDNNGTIDRDDWIAIQNIIKKLPSVLFVIVTNEITEYIQRYSSTIQINSFNNENSPYLIELIRQSNFFDSEKTINNIANLVINSTNGSPRAYVNVLNELRNSNYSALSDNDKEIQFANILNKENNFVDMLSANEKLLLTCMTFIDRPLKTNEMESLKEIFNLDANSLTKLQVYCKMDDFYNYQINSRYLYRLKSYFINNDGFFSMTAVPEWIARCKICFKDELISCIAFLLKKRQNNYRKYDGRIYNYACQLMSNNKTKAIEYLSICKQYIVENIEAKKITKLLPIFFELAYYEEVIYIGKQVVNDISLSLKQKYGIFKLIAYSSTFTDNHDSLVYFDKAEELAPSSTEKHKLKISKLMAKLESSKFSNYAPIQEELKSLLDVLDVTTVEGIALRRNALDFLDTETALSTMINATSQAEVSGEHEELCKLNQNIGLLKIWQRKFDEAQDYTNKAKAYCEKNGLMELSYPLINLAIIELYRYFSGDKINLEHLNRAKDHNSRALDYAKSYYSISICEMNLFTIINQFYKLGDATLLNRINAIQQKWLNKLYSENRSDHTSNSKAYFNLVLNAMQTERYEDAENIMRNKHFISAIQKNKYKNKYNRIIDKLGLSSKLKLKLIDNMYSYDDFICADFKFEAWPISLTHDNIFQSILSKKD
ncbi:MAG: NB-ARC domain-containing protein [Candidatus Gastranaerophilales bacterium]